MLNYFSVAMEYPLHRAVGNPDMMRLLLEHGAPVDAVNADGMTPLHLAAWSGDVASAKLLLLRHIGSNLDTQAPRVEGIKISTRKR